MASHSEDVLGDNSYFKEMMVKTHDKEENIVEYGKNDKHEDDSKYTANLPSVIELNFCSKEWNSLEKSMHKNGKLQQLPKDWVVQMEKKFTEINDFPCCVQFKKHYVYARKESQSKLLYFTFYCNISGCHVRANAVLWSNFKLVIKFDHQVVTHTLDDKNSYKARHMRKCKRISLGKELMHYRYPGKYFLETLADKKKRTWRVGFCQFKARMLLGRQNMKRKRQNSLLQISVRV